MKTFLDYEFRHASGHVEVFLNGKFQFSADTMAEAMHEILHEDGDNK